MGPRLFFLFVCLFFYFSGEAQPVNNACGSAITMSALDGTCLTAQDITGASDDIGPGACSSGSNENVWFSFVAEGVSVDLSIPAGGPGVAQLALVDFNTPCTAAGAVVLGCATGTNHINLDHALVPGQTYFIVVGFQNSSFTGGIGDFE